MKLNLGCGVNHLQGYINVDAFAECRPDIQFDLDKSPWPWQDNSVDEVVMNHSLEHMGATTPVFFSIMKELYRVSKPGAHIRVHVPNPRHDSFLSDPTHVRPITPQMFALFSKRLNHEWQARQISNTPLALYLDVDFEVIESDQILDAFYMERFEQKRIDEEGLMLAIRECNNVIVEYHILLKVMK